jgi:hypothetical protein
MTAEKVFTLGLKLRDRSPFIQYLALKPHEQSKASASGEAGGTALFVSGLPFGTDEAAVKDLFECFGPVSQAVLHPLKVGGGSGTPFVTREPTRGWQLLSLPVAAAVTLVPGWPLPGAA